uniref:Uncharacterized protein n=1 Tax=Romanomermis culicivorax TaxID=13658 RepID=A0A915L635_ROMCU
MTDQDSCGDGHGSGRIGWVALSTLYVVKVVWCIMANDLNNAHVIGDPFNSNTYVCFREFVLVEGIKLEVN